MNTISNFNRNQQINYSKNNKPNNVNFKGYNPLKNINARAFFRDVYTNVHVEDACVNIAYYIEKRPNEILSLTKNASLSKIEFLETVAKKFYDKNYYLKDELKEDSKHVIDIYKSVKNISAEHFQILDKIKVPIKDLSKIFKAANNDKKRLNFALKVNKNIIDNTNENKRYELITELLESPNSNEYIKNFDNYKSFLTLHKSDEHAVKKLDSLIKHGNYDAKKYNIRFANQELFSHNLVETPVLNKETLTQNYTPEGHKFLDAFLKYIVPSKESISAGNDVDILDMYKSTNKSNLQTRINIMKTFTPSQLHNSQFKEKNENITGLNKLFNIIDNDKHAKNAFFKLVNEKLAGFENTQEYIKLFEKVEPKKLDIFHNNAANIICQTKTNYYENLGEYTDILNKEIENPFYMTPNFKENYEAGVQAGWRKKETIFSKVYKFTKNIGNKIRYKYSSDSIPKHLETKTPILPAAINSESEKISTETVKNKEVSEIIDTVKETAKPISETSNIKPATDIVDTPSQKLPRTLEELKTLAKNDSTLEVIEEKNSNVIFRQKDPTTGRAQVDYVFDENIKPLASKEYIYNEQGNVAKEVMRDKENNISGIYEYQYDELNRPIQELYSDANGFPQVLEEYTYNGNAQKLSSVTRFAYEFDENNVLIRKQTTEYKDGVMTKLLDERMDGMTEFSYDSEGNIVKEVIADAEGNVQEIREAQAAAVETTKAPSAVEITESVIAENEAATAKPARKRVVNKFVPKAPNAKKLAVINDVNGIIEKKLGTKTLSEQKRDYAITATKMRMQMLPEIFESIKDTRKAERAAGKTKMSVSNKDALTLYERINGRNKRLVNYMLKKRNADGTRTFGIKDIINTIDSTEKQIRTEKAANKDFRAADAKLMYNNLLNTQIEQYGKLQRNKKK